MSFDYENDSFGKLCLELAEKSKGALGFGALLVKDGKILGRGWNHRPEPKERGIVTHVDYAIHAEQAAYVDARLQGISADKLIGSTIYVLGKALKGKNRGKLTIGDRKVFICKKCPVSVLIPHNISVHIPHYEGWCRLSPEEALQTTKECGEGYWKKFIKE